MQLNNYANTNFWFTFLEFQTKFDCDSVFKHHTYCFATQPSDWNENDKQSILSAYDEWPQIAHDLIDKKIKFYRVGYGYSPRGIVSLRKKDVYAWIEQPNKIFITDLFIQTQKLIEGGIYSFHSYVLLHETAHLFDGRRSKFSQSEEFLDLYGWEQIDDPSSNNMYNTKKWVMNDVDQGELESKRQFLLELHNQGQRVEAARQSLIYAADYGLPTMYATTNPAECFAELLTNYIMAPELNSQILPEALLWLENLFLPTD